MRPALWVTSLIAVVCLLLRWTSAPDAAAQPADPTSTPPPFAVTVSAPLSGTVLADIVLVAAVAPATATGPFTYTWQADNQLPLTHTDSLTATDQAAFRWLAPGSVAVTVTVSGPQGAASGTAQIALPPVTRVAALAAGGAHVCALIAPAGGVECWGSNAGGQLGLGDTVDRLTAQAVPALADSVQALAAGVDHTCALTLAGGVQCWGRNYNGQLGVGDVLTRLVPSAVAGLGSGVRALAAGAYHTCALLKAGGVQCWGYNGYGQLGDGGLTDQVTPVVVAGLAGNVAALTAGGMHTCALLDSGGVQCWGLNAAVVGGSFTNSLVPVTVTGLPGPVQALSAGGAHTCALLADGSLSCWGDSLLGQLGIPGIYSATAPSAVPGLTSGVLSVAAGDLHTCVVLAGGGAQCWGENLTGQLGDGTTDRHTAPADVAGLTSGVQSIVTSPGFSVIDGMGGGNACALLTDGQVDCWGDNYLGQLGDGTRNVRPTPVTLPLVAGGAQSLSVGWRHTCVTTAAGGLRCLGYNANGELGDGTTTFRYAWTDTFGLVAGVQAPAVRGGCAVITGGNGVCWGDNRYGQLGNGTLTSTLTPGAVLSLTSGVQAVVVGASHACALTAAGGVKCWGDNTAGQAGDGTFQRRLTAVAVVSLTTGVQALAAGGFHTCALLLGGGLKCWGADSYGALGDNDPAPLHAQNMPVDVSGLAGGVQSVTAGLNHTCALLNTGTVKCWGRNDYGQLGLGDTLSRTVPVDVPGLTGVLALAGGDLHTCALLAGGLVKCWGYNSMGQLGDGTFINRLTPVAVPGVTGVKAIGAGYLHTCALTTDNQVQCWGTDDSGQLGFDPGWRPREALIQQITGRVTGAPAGVLLTSSRGLTTTTDAGGYYTFTVFSGAQVITPSLPAYTFSPVDRAVNVAPFAVHQDFAAVSLTPPASPTGTATPSPTLTPTPSATFSPTPWPTWTPSATPQPGVPPTATPLPAPLVLAVAPAHSLAGQAVTLTLQGAYFAGLPTVFLGNIALGPAASATASVLTVLVPAGPPAGVYAVKVCNPEGQCGQLPEAFTLSSADALLTKLSPAHGFNDAPNDVVAHGFNFHAGLTGTIGAWPLLAVTLLNDTHARLTLPAGLPAGIYTVTLQNPDSLTPSRLADAYTVQDPNNLDFSVTADDLWTSPPTVRQGDRVQLGVNVHRQGGPTTLTPLVEFFLGNPDVGGQLLGWAAPAIAAGQTGVAAIGWDTAGLAGAVEIYVRVDPLHALPDANSTNNSAHRAFILLPPDRDSTAPVLTGLTVVGEAVTASAAVTLSLQASDPGGSGVASMYLEEWELNPAAREWVLAQSTGWVPFAAVTTLPLTPHGGTHWLYARVADRFGNISAARAEAVIDYLPAEETLWRGQVRVYRRYVSAGAVFTATLTTLAGDADLYLWAPDGTRAGYSAEAGLAPDNVQFTAAAAGVYQIEVYADQDARFQLQLPAPLAPAWAAASVAPAAKTLRAAPVLAASQQPAAHTAVPAAPMDVIWRLYLPLTSKSAGP